MRDFVHEVEPKIQEAANGFGFNLKPSMCDRLHNLFFLESGLHAQHTIISKYFAANNNNKAFNPKQVGVG